MPNIPRYQMPGGIYEIVIDIGAHNYKLLVDARGMDEFDRIADAKRQAVEWTRDDPRAVYQEPTLWA